MAIPVHLQQFKAAGIYRVVWDKSTIQNQDTSMIRLVVGYSEKGPFNIPVYVKDTADFVANFGGISKKLEKRGIYFHRMALEMLKVSPILCLNLKKFAGETVDGASISTEFNPKFDPIDSVKLRIEDVYTTTRFWELDAQKLNNLTTATGSRMSQYINISQTSEKADSVTYFIRKASGSKVAGYNITVNDWYSDEKDNLPEFLENHKGDLMSDYFAEIYVFNGKFETSQVLSSTTLKNYFDVEKNESGEYELKLKKFYLNAFGESLDTLDALYSDMTSNPIGHYVGSLIPYFKDKQGVYASLDVVFNNDQTLHHLMMAFNEDLLEEGLVDINLSGRDAIIADSCTDTRLLNSANAITLDKIYYGTEEQQLDENGNVKHHTTDSANAYNATLEGAAPYLTSMPRYSAVEAAKYNATLQGAVKLGDEMSARQYNATLPGAGHEGDTIKWTQADADIYNAKADITGAAHVSAGQVKFYLDTQEEADAYNTTLDGAVKDVNGVKVFSNLDEVNEYNEKNLEGAVHENEAKDGYDYKYTESMAAKYNEKLDGAVHIGDYATWSSQNAKTYNELLPYAKHLHDAPIYWTQEEVDAYNLKSLKAYYDKLFINYDESYPTAIDWTALELDQIKPGFDFVGISSKYVYYHFYSADYEYGDTADDTLLFAELVSRVIKDFNDYNAIINIPRPVRDKLGTWVRTWENISDWTSETAETAKRCLYDYYAIVLLHIQQVIFFDIANGADGHWGYHVDEHGIPYQYGSVPPSLPEDHTLPTVTGDWSVIGGEYAVDYDYILGKYASRLINGDRSRSRIDNMYITTNLIKFNFDSEADVERYNNALDDAVHAGDPVDTTTQLGVNRYNKTLNDAKQAQTSIDLTNQTEVNEYNSCLYGAAKAGDIVVKLVPVTTSLLGNLNAPIIAETMTIGNSLFNEYNELNYPFDYNGKNKKNVTINGSFYVSDFDFDEGASKFNSNNPIATFKEISDGKHLFTVEFDPSVVSYYRGKQYVKFLKECGVFVEAVSEAGAVEYKLDRELTTTYLEDAESIYTIVDNDATPAKQEISFKDGSLKQFVSSVYRLDTVDSLEYKYKDSKNIAVATVIDISYTTHVTVLNEANNDNVKNNVYGSSLSFIYIANTNWQIEKGVNINSVFCDVLISNEDSLQSILSVGDYLLANDGTLDANNDGILNSLDKDSYYDVVQVQEMGAFTDEDGKQQYYIKLTGMPKIYTPGQGNGSSYIIKYNGALNQEIGKMKPMYLEGYTFVNARPTGVSMYAKLQWQKDILSTLSDYRGLRTALLNKSEIDYRYVIDTFESFPTDSLKVELATLCKEKQSAFCIANFPSVKTFVKCPYASFTDAQGNFNVQYIVDGMNKKKAASVKFSLPSDFDGASFIAFYSPLKFSDGYIDTIVPSAGHVSNLFVEKYMSRQPYYIVAGPNYGSINAAGLVGPDYRYSRDELQIIEPFGVNVMVYRPNFGTFINANQTAKQTPLSALSKVHVRELVIYLQDEIEKVLQSYQWEFNNTRTRNAILDKANSICELIMANGGLQAYRNIMDETNNTPDIIDNEMAVISTHIEPGMGCGKMVQELTLYRTGKMTAALQDM